MLRNLFILFMIAMVVGVVEVRAQKFEVTPFFGYRWGGELSDGSYSNYGPYVVSLDFASGPSYGVIAGYYIKPRYQIEVFWDRQETTLKVVNKTLDTSEDLADGKIDYIHAGLLMMLLPDDYKLKPFFSFSLGATQIIPSDSSIDSEWFSSVGFALGAKYYFSEHVGVRVSTRGVSTVVTDGDQYFCDEDEVNGQGCFVLPKDTWMWQIDLTLGVIVAF